MSKDSRDSNKISHISNEIIEFIELVGTAQLTEWSQIPECANTGYYIEILDQYNIHLSGEKGGASSNDGINE